MQVPHYQGLRLIRRILKNTIKAKQISCCLRCGFLFIKKKKKVLVCEFHLL